MDHPLDTLTNEELLEMVKERGLLDKFIRVQKCVLIRFLREEEASSSSSRRYSRRELEAMTIPTLKVLYHDLGLKEAVSKYKTKSSLVDVIVNATPPSRSSSPKSPLRSFSPKKGKEPSVPGSPRSVPSRSKSPRRQTDLLKALYTLKHSPGRLTEEKINTLSAVGIEQRQIQVSNGTYSYTWFNMSRYDDLSPVEQLHLAGVTTIPLISLSDLPEYQRWFDETLESFPEYKRNPENPRLDMNGNPLVYVAGGFAALGNPASFHNSLSRDLRMRGFKAVHTLLAEYKNRLLRDDENYQVQALSDRLMFRQKGQKPTAEAWHRDVMPGDKLGYSDEIFGGWINLDSVDQYFSCIPGSHLDIIQKNLRPGFATLHEAVERIYKEENKTATEKEKMTAVREVSKDKHIFRVPPGNCVIFPQYILHDVVANAAKYDMRRQFTGWRMTSKEDLLYPLSMFDEQAVIPLPGGMIPPLYSKSHLTYFQDKRFKLAQGVSYSLKEWSKATFKDECITKKGIVERHMHSLQEYGFELYEEYSKEEKRILTGVPL